MISEKRLINGLRLYVAIILCLFVFTPNIYANEKAVTYSADDPSIAWGGCPAFIPEGCEIGVLHGDPAKPNTDIFFKVPANFEIPHHYHTSAERMVLISGVMTVSYDNQEKETMNPGTYGYGPAKLPHTAFCEAGDPCVLFIAFEEPVDAFEMMKAE